MLELNQPPASTSAGGMLSFLSNMDNRAGLVLNPPLAALHTMTDMKSLYSQQSVKSLSPQSPPQLSPQGLSPQELAISYATAASTAAATTTSSSMATPHNIENILNRPSPLMTTSTGLCGVGQMGGMSGLGRLGGSMSLYSGLAGKMADLARPTSVYWPGVQGMLQNPLFWRERLQTSHGESLVPRPRALLHAARVNDRHVPFGVESGGVLATSTLLFASSAPPSCRAVVIRFLF